MHILPCYTYMYERNNDYENMERYRLMDCIECGACTYVLPGPPASDPLLPHGQGQAGCQGCGGKRRAPRPKRKRLEAEKEASSGKEEKE